MHQKLAPSLHQKLAPRGWGGVGGVLLTYLLTRERDLFPVVYCMTLILYIPSTLPCGLLYETNTVYCIFPPPNYAYALLSPPTSIYPNSWPNNTDLIFLEINIYLFDWVRIKEQIGKNKQVLIRLKW